MEEILKEILAELKKINDKLETRQKKENGLTADLIPAIRELTADTIPTAK
ncbi:hypothetical protein [Biomaibacter acetigenes]|nr:hypothetical protein [Biomaibacter acetigenes]